MIDTIKLTLDRSLFIITEPKKFHPNSDTVLWNDKILLAKAIQNQSREDTQNKIYKPKLTIIRAYGDVHLTIEFSVPKLIFGNNFEEVGGKDFDLVIKKLKAVLAEMGVSISEECLKEAKVTMVHYGKNFILTDDAINPTTMINLIAKADTTFRTDITQKDYRNGGQLVSFYSKVQEVVFYDKMKDLQRSLNISKDRSEEVDAELQRQFLSEYGRHEVLRMEVRLAKPEKIKGVMYKMLNKEFNIVTFQDAYDEHLAKKILKSYLRDIKNMLHDVIASQRDSNDALQFLLAEGIPQKKAFIHVKAMELIPKYGERHFRIMFPVIYRGYKALMKTSIGKALTNETYDESLFTKAFNKLEDVLYYFRPIRLENGKDIYGNVAITGSSSNANNEDFEFLPPRVNPKYRHEKLGNVKSSPEQEREDIISDFLEDEEETKI